MKYLIAHRKLRLFRVGNGNLEISVLLILGALVLSGCVRTQGTQSDSESATSAVSEPTSTNLSNEVARATSEGAIHEVAVRIDTMMCVEGCFNGIKELLEKRSGIEEVRLAPQKEEGTIDNSMVYIKHRGELNKAEIERLILGAGFDKLEFIK